MDAANQFIRQLANDVLVWVGFGTIIGLIAKGVMPGRDPGGAIANLAMGVGGTVIGCGIFSFFFVDGRVTPISPGGACVALGGALTLLFFYRLLAGYFFTEGETSLKIHQTNRARRQRSTRRAA